MVNIWIWAFFAIVIASSLGVITSRSPVVAVLFLVSVFVETAIIFIVLGVEFYSVLLFTVYVGAIAILFLFVVMMFNLRLMDLYGNAYYHVASGHWIGVTQIAILILVISHDFELVNFSVWNDTNSHTTWLLQEDSNLEMLGITLYNYYMDLFLIIGLVLFLAMVGVITIALTEKPHMENKSNRRYSLDNLEWYNIKDFVKNNAGISKNI